MFAGTPETRRMTARVYGDGSLPFTLSDSNKKPLLSWRNGEGNVEGKANGYNVYAWKSWGEVRSIRIGGNRI